MGGAADTGDGKVTAKELDAYLQEVVPELTQKYKGDATVPVELWVWAMFSSSAELHGLWHKFSMNL